MAAAEATVLKLMQRDNKPFGLQTLVDLLAHQGLKKAAISKALDALAESGKVVAKEFGKTKVFIPTQSDLAVLSKEEMDAKMASIKQLSAELQQEKTGLRDMEQELQSWKSSLTDSELLEAIQQCKEQLASKQARLSQLQSGAVLVSAVERAAAVKALSQAMEGWKKRRAIFRNIWDTISEGVEGKQEEVFEEMGVETDEAVGVSLKDMELLMPTSGPNKRPRTALGAVN